MTPLERHHQFSEISWQGAALYLKPGVRGFPDPPPAAALFLEVDTRGKAGVVDASGTAGAVALGWAGARRAAAAAAVTAEPGESETRASLVLEPSMAALRCAARSLGRRGILLRPGLPWDLPPGRALQLAMAPPADRGNARVEAEIAAAAAALHDEGVLWLAVHKDQGGKRYQKLAQSRFAEVEVRARSRGWRLLEARYPSSRTAAGEGAGGLSVPWTDFSYEGMSVAALPGVHAAGRLDPGTSLLLRTVPWTAGADTQLLDLGCGSGVLALRGASAGAHVTASDDDLAAVRSARRNARAAGLDVDVVHSDVDSALEGRRFDLVVCNPPFHVGRGVRLDLPAAFIEAARKLLRPGGELWLVANRDLPYESRSEGWASIRRVADEGGFKVLLLRR